MNVLRAAISAAVYYHAAARNATVVYAYRSPRNIPAGNLPSVHIYAAFNAPLADGSVFVGVDRGDIASCRALPLQCSI